MPSPLLIQQPPQTADEASAQQLLALASDALRTRRLGEVAELQLAAQWAVLHGQPTDARDAMVTPGGDGTPSVREYALPELAMARETHLFTTRALVADALDLLHRLPLTWAVVVTGGCEPWVARKVAVITRSLLSETVGVVDRAVARAIAGHAPSSVLEIARVTAGDAAWIDAMVDRVAEILALTHGHDHNHDELRSLAMGWLARPLELLKLLLQHTDLEADPETGEPARPA